VLEVERAHSSVIYDRPAIGGDSRQRVEKDFTKGDQAG
jgi:hypothetical protein